MIVGAPRESSSNEARVAMTPASARELQKLGHTCQIESGAGDAAGYSDQTYTCLLYTSPSPRDRTRSRMPSSA